MVSLTPSAGREVSIRLSKEGLELKGLLSLPEGCDAIILFAHGSGSGRFSPRNQYVARLFEKGGFGTMLMDLLTEEEGEIDEGTREFRFDIPLLARRLVGVSQWLRKQDDTRNLKVAYFGSSTGAAAALIAAAEEGTGISAVVSRGGRPDLALSVLSEVHAPTLFIVGEHDFDVIELNQKAFDQLTTEKKMVLVPGATHLFEEPGALEEVARLSLEWFKKHC